MTARDEHIRRPRAPIRAPKPAIVRYLVAVAASVAGVVVTEAIFESGVADQPIYAPLIAVVALTSWYGGFGPSALAIVLCWTSALLLLDEPRGEFSFGTTDDMVRWWINLAVVLVIAAVGGILRTRMERSAVEADTARSDIREIESLQELTIALTAAVSSSDVILAVSSHSRGILGASGVALGLADGEELVIAAAELAPGTPDVSRLPLADETVMTEAARTGSVAVAEDRESLRRSYPDSAAALPPSVERALALPLRAEGAVIGSLGFQFERDTQVDGDTLALARIVADLAGQALERARLYESERETRRALDRILRVAPSFRREDADDVAGVICREARSTFGADYGVLWRVRDDGLHLLAIDPPRPDLVGRRLRLGDFPILREAIEGLGSSFIPDVLDTTHGDGRAFVTELGIRSSLRTPVVIAGASELVLALSWQVVVSEPDQATIAVVRRFADQAGLALEQVERRRAEADAERRAEATRRLQEVTAALSAATTVLDVSTICLDKALDSVGAEAGFIVLTGPTGTSAVELVASAGYDDDELDAWRASDLDSEVPFARAIALGEPVWALSGDAMSAFTDVREARTAGWVTLPLMTRGGARGALHLSLRSPRSFTRDDREWLGSMVAQCGLALERASQYEAEQTIAETLQRSVLPSSLPRVDGVELAARYLPGSAQLDVGGDWFDALQLPDGKLGLVVGDVVGKGVQAAASMAQLRNAIRAFSVDRLKPSSVLVRLNRLADEVLDTSFATVVYLALEPETGVCRLSAARGRLSRRTDRADRRRARPPARYRHPHDVSPGDVRAPARKRRRPLHGRADRASRPLHRRGARESEDGPGIGSERSGPAPRPHPRTRRRRGRAWRRHRAPGRPHPSRRSAAARAPTPRRPRLPHGRTRRAACVAQRGRARTVGSRGGRPRHVGGVCQRHRACRRARRWNRGRPRQYRGLPDPGHGRRHRPLGSAV